MAFVHVLTLYYGKFYHNIMVSQTIIWIRTGSFCQRRSPNCQEISITFTPLFILLLKLLSYIFCCLLPLAFCLPLPKVKLILHRYLAFGVAECRYDFAPLTPQLWQGCFIPVKNEWGVGEMGNWRDL
jgi:hypothetical protein